MSHNDVSDQMAQMGATIGTRLARPTDYERLRQIITAGLMALRENKDTPHVVTLRLSGAQLLDFLSLGLSPSPYAEKRADGSYDGGGPAPKAHEKRTQARIVTPEVVEMVKRLKPGEWFIVDGTKELSDMAQRNTLGVLRRVLAKDDDVSGVSAWRAKDGSGIVVKSQPRCCTPRRHGLRR